MKKLIYDWPVEDYIRVVENSTHPLMKGYEEDELRYLQTQIENSGHKTIIDVGAGYGRVLPHLVHLFRNFIGVEINNQMFDELEKRVQKYSNAQAIKGDADNLYSLLSSSNIARPVLVCLQNSFGTWEGDYKKAFLEMRKNAEEKAGEIIVSSWRGELFRDFAIDIYSSLKAVVGKPDSEKSDFSKAIFKSKTGYVSKWWLPEEREEIKKLLGGKTVREILGTPYFIIHVSY